MKNVKFGLCLLLVGFSIFYGSKVHGQCFQQLHSDSCCCMQNSVAPVYTPCFGQTASVSSPWMTNPNYSYVSNSCGCVQCGCVPSTCSHVSNTYVSSSDDPVQLQQRILLSDNGTCSATYNVELQRWIITAGCGLGCRCPVPDDSVSGAIAAATFNCKRNVLPTTERFYLDFSVRNSGVHNLVFSVPDSSRPHKFPARLTTFGTALWDVTASWMPNAVDQTPRPSNIDPTKQGTVELNWDPQPGSSRTYSLARGEQPMEIFFGKWKVEITRL